MKIVRIWYKYQIEQELIKHKWEIVTIGENEEWWDDEHWKVAFKYDASIYFYLCFVVDPMIGGCGVNRKKGQGTYGIKASKEFPEDWPEYVNDIASFYLSSRKFNVRLKEFMVRIEKYKRKVAASK